MIEIEKDRRIIAVDNGYQLVKTASKVFSNGVHYLGEAEPSLVENSLKYEGRYYKIGESRASITENKLDGEQARLITMVAIARELEEKGITEAQVVLAVGLPFSGYGREKRALIEYYGEKPVLDFSFEQKEYHISLVQVMVFPQCYSAIAPRLMNMDDDYLIVDIGSKTTDVVFVSHGRPLESRSITIEKALVKWIKQIQGRLQAQYGKDVPEDEILKIMLKKEHFLPREYADLVEGTLTEQVEELILELGERGYNLEYMNVIFVGGGAVVVKNYARQYRANYLFDCNIRANAEGYEYLAKAIVERGE